MTTTETDQLRVDRSDDRQVVDHQVTQGVLSEEDELVEEESLVEEISIDGMCGVY